MEVDQIRIGPEDWPEALADIDGRQIVVAGPGAGKTEFLVRRVARILGSGAARPREVIVLSFSRRATSKLKDRIQQTVGYTGVPIDVTTFHSVALRLIETTTPGDRPIPLTTPEQVGLVREVLATEDPSDWPLTYRGVLDNQAFSAEVADFLLRCSERLLTPEDLELRARDRADWRGLPGLYRRYRRRLDSLGRTDYGMLLTRAVDLLRTDAGADLASRFRYVLVDEYQDTTPAQAAMADLVSLEHGNLTVAGDPYQSIFSFRGAELRNIAVFSDRADAKRYVLDRSFRVPGPIMDAALRVVSGGDLPGSAGPVRPADHRGRSDVFVFDQQTAEAEWIATEIERLIRIEGFEPADIAVVVRSKRELIAELSRALDRRSLPHDPPDSRLVDHPAVGVVQDVVTAAIGNEDRSADPLGAVAVDRAMRRLLLGPLVGATVAMERQMARERNRGHSWSEVLTAHLPDLTGLLHLITDPTWATESEAAHGFWTLWTTLDGIADLVNSPDRGEWRRAWTAFGQMLSRQAERDDTVSLARFFELVEEDDFEPTPLISHRLTRDRITLTTLHQVKGLEFDVVFIANAVEGVFPDLRRSRRMLRPELLSPERTVDPEAQHLFQIQEEMRLAYTAMTRARRRVVWTATEAGIDQGERRPSRFLLAAAGDTAPGPPRGEERDPITIREAETYMRRVLLDVDEGPARRLAAARVLGSPSRDWWNPTTFAGAVIPGPDSPVMGSSFRLSPSQAESYKRCPRRYVLERRLRLGDSTSVYAHFGDLAHRVLEIAESEVIGDGVRHAEIGRVLEIVDDVWKEADFGAPELDEAWKTKAEEMFVKLYDMWPGKGEPIETELAVELDIGGVRWMGRVDRLERSEEGLRVVDYKTGTSVMTHAEAEESIQLGFYAMAVEDDPDQVIASEMWYPRHGSTKSVATRKLDMNRLGELAETMATITGAIVSEDWAPRVSESCKRCDFRRFCPAWPEGKGAFLP